MTCCDLLMGKKNQKKNTTLAEAAVVLQKEVKTSVVKINTKTEIYICVWFPTFLSFYL